MKSSPRQCGWLLLLLGWALLVGVLPVRAQTGGPPNPLDQVAFDQHLNAALPLGLVFHDDEGASVTLGTYFGQKPAILVLAYYTCPNLCPLLLHGLATSLNDLAFRAGKEFDVVVVSINPRETPAIAKMTKAMLLPGVNPAVARGWHLLTGDEPMIERLATTVGVHYAWDAAQQQYAHPSGIMLVTAQGHLARYLYGIQYQIRDLRLGLIEASANQIGSPLDQVLLRCYHYDPVSGTYSLVVMNIVRGAAVITTLLVLAALLILFRRERLQSGQLAAPPIPQSGDTV
ncbi:MAG: SCO family protein [Herpetosiphonaceae bacterium]|nr:SCO family protein [Herpetosiphonaceae bacterium]